MNTQLHHKYVNLLHLVNRIHRTRRELTLRIQERTFANLLRDAKEEIIIHLKEHICETRPDFFDS